MEPNKRKVLHLVGSLGLDGSSKVILDLCASLEPDYEFCIVTLKKNFKAFPDVPSNIKIHQFNFDEDLDYSLLGYLRNWFDKRSWRKSTQPLSIYLSGLILICSIVILIREIS